MSHWQFPTWHYGYTQMPNYTSFGGPSGSYPYRGRGRPTGQPYGNKPSGTGVPAIIPTPLTIKEEKPETGGVKTDVTSSGEQSAGGGDVKAVSAVHRGRNSVLYCHDQSILRGMELSWEQVAEAGPPHARTYEYRLNLGEFSTLGQGKTKKEAKTKAADEMAFKLDELPRVNKRPLDGWGHSRPYGRGGVRGRGGRFNLPPWKRRKGMENEESILKKNDKTPKPDLASINNPVAKLYEYCKKKKWPDPIFDCIAEDMQNEVRTHKGFVLRKYNFTLMCTVKRPGGEDKIFYGTASTKKAAKLAAAEAAWAEISAGVTQKSVQDLITKERSASQSEAVVTPEAEAVTPVV